LIALAFAMGENPFAKYSDAMAYQALMEKVEQAMIAGKPFVKNYWTNGDALLQSMRSGEVYIAMAWDNAGWKLHAENPNIDFVAPRSGALGWIDTFAIPAKAKNVEAAYKWINFMLKPENAALFTKLKNMERLPKAQANTWMPMYAEILSAAFRWRPLPISNGIRPFRPSWNKLKVKFWIRSKPRNSRPDICCAK
jgi:spermidine/putrescine-binding protein